MKHILPLATLSAALAFGSCLLRAKESGYPVPELPSSADSSEEILAGLSQWRQLTPVQRRRLADGLFHRCFGGADPMADWLEQPRACLALWLALTSHEIVQQPTSVVDHLEALSHLQRQKVLDPVSGHFFRGLWEFAREGSREQAAADYLRGWLARFDLRVPSAQVTQATAEAVVAGVVSLKFLQPLEPRQQK